MISQHNQEDSKRFKAAVIGSVLGLLSALFGGFFLILRIVGGTGMVTTTPTATSIPTRPLQITSTPNISLTITAISVEEHSSYTLYRDRVLWENAIGENTRTENFEKDAVDYGELSFPYLTGNGFLLTGQSAAQIIQDATLIDDGNHIHFRDWATGLTFYFPDDKFVGAFGFDYRAHEPWQLRFNDSIITLPEGRRGFIGVIVQKSFPKEFNLSGSEYAQGGISIDNISYVVSNSP